MSEFTIQLSAHNRGSRVFGAAFQHAEHVKFHVIWLDIVIRGQRLIFEIQRLDQMRCDNDNKL